MNLTELFLILPLVATVFTALPAQAGETPETILKKADAIRNPADSFRMRVQVKNTDDITFRFEVLTKGKDKTLIKTLEPKRDVGRNMLMLDENMWAYIPNLKRAVRVSLNQKLTGEAANGDISRMRWSGDYDAKIESESKSTWVLFLTAKKKGLTYDKIRVWVEKDSFQPQKADYLTLSGAPLKHATFKGYKQIAGAMRPTEIKIIDAKRQDQISTIVIEELEKKDLPDALFRQTNLQ